MTIPAGLAWMADHPVASAWLPTLPGLIDEVAHEWGLSSIGRPYAGASVSWAAPAVRDGHEVAVKIQWPHPECEHEAAALRRWDGNGAVRLIAHDPDRHALLLERCTPGTRLAEAAEPGGVDAIEVMVDLLPRLWRPPSAPFRPLADEAADWRSTLWEDWAAAGEPCERRLVEAADEALRDLPPTQGETVLLHQDLHGDNVLASERGWLAVDPKPLLGERELGAAPIIRDFTLGPERDQVLHRFDRLTAELGLDRDRTRGWTIAQTIAWAFDSGHADQHYDTVRFLLA
jgi:streptomycin 6-kinase